MFPSDLDIARSAPMKPLAEIAEQMGIGEHLLEPYGRNVAKIRLEAIDDLARPATGALRGRHGDHPDAARRGQDDDDGRPRPGDEARRQAGRDQRPPTVDGPDVRHQGRCRRRRLQPGPADGTAQPAPHRRLPRRHVGAQPARRDGRQPPVPRQRAGPRPRQHHLAPRARRQRPGAPQHRGRDRPEGRRGDTPERLRHHGVVRGDGRPRAGELARRPARPARTHRRRLHDGRRTGHRRAAPRRRVDGGHACATRSCRTCCRRWSTRR